MPSNSSVPAIDEDISDDLNREVAMAESLIVPIDVATCDPITALRDLSDDHFVIETRADFSKDIATAFIKLNGATIGVIANKEKKFTTDGLKKASEFVITCDSLGIPILTITNNAGFDTTFETEKDGVTEIANLTVAFANATVPKVNLIVGDATGTGYMVMNPKALGADIVYAWPEAKVSVMDSKRASEVMYGDASKAPEYDKLQGDINKVASRGYIDSIINPVDTRKYLIGAFEMLYTKEI